MYLTRYGYMPHPNMSSGRSAALIDSSAMEGPIKEFQRFAGLNVTGILDKKTMDMMAMPRCGVKDKVGYGSKARRKKRYALQGKNTARFIFQFFKEDFQYRIL